MNTFAVDENGQIWSWGGGNLGFKDDYISDLPRKIVENTENRKFIEIFAISNSTVFFSRICPIFYTIKKYYIYVNNF